MFTRVVSVVYIRYVIDCECLFDWFEWINEIYLAYLFLECYPNTTFIWWCNVYIGIIVNKFIIHIFGNVNNFILLSLSIW